MPPGATRLYDIELLAAKA